LKTEKLLEGYLLISTFKTIENFYQIIEKISCLSMKKFVPLQPI